MTQRDKPKPGESLKSTDAFFAIGFVFFVLGLTGDNNVAFLAVGLAMVAIGLAGRARSRKDGR